MNNNQIYEFKKIPTTDNEEFFDTKISYEEMDDNINLLKNKWLYIFLTIFSMIFILWLSSELYWIFFEINITKGNSKLSIIINADEKHNLAHLLRSLASQMFSTYEIIITKKNQSKFSELAFSKFKRRNSKIRIIQYNEKDTKIKIRIDSASAAMGDYILFLDSDDYFYENILSESYITAIQKNIDITQFNYFHDDLEPNEIIYQPRLFDSIYFNKDIIEQTQFHLSGKIIKKEIFLKAMKDIDNYYLENNNNIYFEESIIIFKLFKIANSFIKLQKEGKIICKKKLCSKKFLHQNNYSRDEIKEILIYLKFLIQYTDENVLEKRMASKFFLNFVVEKTQTKNHYDQELIRLLEEVVNLYSKCELINEEEIKLINNYRNEIKFLRN